VNVQLRRREGSRGKALTFPFKLAVAFEELTE
jgi:hypothetical protein